MIKPQLVLQILRRQARFGSFPVAIVKRDLLAVDALEADVLFMLSRIGR